LLAREAPEGTLLRWVRETLDGLNRFPDSALAALQTWEAEAREADARAARAAAEFAATVAEAEARFPGLNPPSDAEIARRDQVRTKPIAQPGEPIGLALNRRGALADDTLVGHASDVAQSGEVAT
jgi:hypothetical protein